MSDKGKTSNTNTPPKDGQYYDRELTGGDYVSHLSHSVKATPYKDDQAFAPDEPISQEQKKQRIISSYLDTYSEKLTTAEKHRETEQKTQSQSNIEEEIPPFENALHPDIEHEQNAFTVPNLDAMATEYKTFSSNLDHKFEKMGILGEGFIFIKKLITALLYLVLLAAVLVGAVCIIVGQVFFYIFGSFFGGISGGISFVMERIATFVVLTIVFMAGWHLFWKMNPELSLRVDEWGNKLHMYSQKYLGGFSLPSINFFDDAVEDTVRSGMGAMGLDSNKLPSLPSFPTGRSNPLSGLPNLTSATSLLDILPKDMIENAVPKEFAPLINASGDPQAVAAFSNIFSKGITPNNVEKALPVLKNTLLSTQSNEMRGAVLDTLKNIHSPVARKIIRDYEKLIGR